MALNAKILLCLWLVAAADWLFYAQPLGWTAGLFSGVVLLALVFAHRNFLRSAYSKIVAGGLAGLALCLVNNPSPLAMEIFAGGLATLLLLHKRRELQNTGLWLKDMICLAFAVPLQWKRDLARVKIFRAKRGRRLAPQHLPRLMLPLGLTVVFVLLFAQANPVISGMFSNVDWEYYLDSFFSPLRWLVWAAWAAVLWAFLRPRSKLAKPVTTSLAGVDLDRWLDRSSLVFSLAVFNLLFAVQNGLDIAFLWTGQGKDFPDGLTYAEYAHAGAYPLIITALLAGAYVLVTFDQHQKQYQSPAARGLVTAWVMQNIFLVASSVDRTLAYIDTYSLTYLRVAALIWMGLVALGLALIIVKIFFHKSNMWLINMNALALAGVLYGCCFANFDALIANYNVRHAGEVRGMGAVLDFVYMRELGTEAIPALHWFETHAQYSPAHAAAAGVIAQNLEKNLEQTSGNWRAWTWRRQKAMDSFTALHPKNPPEPIGKTGWETEE